MGMSKNFIEFNVNNYVWIRLTPFGKEIVKKWKEEIPLRVIPEEDEDGWAQWQLWELMNTFGEYLYNGGTIPFEMNIRIPI